MARKIAILVPEMLPVPPSKGGAVEQWVYVIGRELAKLDNSRLTIVSRSGSGQEPHSGVYFLGLNRTGFEDYLESFRQRLGKRGILSFAMKMCCVLAYSFRVLTQCRNQDLYYVHNEPLLALLLAWLYPGSVILHMHNQHLESPLVRPLMRLTLRRFKSILFVSEYVRNSAAKVYPQATVPFVSIYNGVDTLAFKAYTSYQLANPPRVLYVGRLTEEKGVHILIDAALKLADRGIPIKLVLAGSSFFEGAPETPYIKDIQAAALPLRFVKHSELPAVFGSADIVVVPSVWQDPCPLVVLEAMACGRPIVATRVGGVPELLKDGYNGLLVDPLSAEELSSAIDKLVNSLHLREQLGRNARISVESALTWEQVAKKVKMELDCA
jgi:spore coat protein SA